MDEFGVDHIFQFLNNPVGYIEQLINKFLANPVAALANPASLFFDGDELPAAFLQALPPFYYLYPVAIAPVGSVGGFMGLAGLPQPAVAAALEPVAPTLAPVAAAPETLPAAGMAPISGAPVAASATVPAPTTTPATSTVASSAPPTPSPAAGVAGFGYPYIVGGPGVGFDSGMSTSASSSSKRKAPEPDTAAAPAVAAAREQARARRRQRAKLRGYGEEFMDMDVEVDPDWDAPPGEEPVASTAAAGHGAGPLGFFGTVHKEAGGQAAGLTTLAGDEFGGGPRVPMLPGTWEHDGEPERGDHT